MEDSEDDGSIDYNYSLTSAVSDFKKGVLYYQKKKWKSAYPLIKRAISKFQKENQAKMTLECSFLLGNILMQLEKYANAIPYFELNQDLAQQMTHLQYWENSTFNRAYCNYKLENFEKAIQYFSQIDCNKIQFVNLVHYYIFLGRSHAKLENFEKANENLLKSVSILQNDSRFSSPKDQIQLAKVFSELGQITFSMNLRDIKQNGFSFFQTEIFSHRINQSIDFFLKSVELWEILEDKNQQIEILQIVANIYGYLQDSELQIHYMQTALDLAEEIRDFQKLISILRYLTQFHKKMEHYTEIISLLQNALETFSQYVYTDQIVIAEFRYELGNSLFHIEDSKGALKQLFAALNTYQKLEIPLEIELKVTQLIIQIYTAQQDQENQAYYQRKYDLLTEKFQNTIIPLESNIGALEDLWIFTQNGIEIYSNNLNLKLNPTLFGGFVSALHSLSMEITKETLKSFVIGSNRFTIYAEPKQKLHILGRSPLTVPETIVNRILRKINQIFYERYENHIINFVGNVTPFSNFTEYLSQIDFNLL